VTEISITTDRKEQVMLLFIIIKLKVSNMKNVSMYSLFGDSENRENNYLKIRDLLSIALFNILGTHYLIFRTRIFISILAYTSVDVASGSLFLAINFVRKFC
jgi:hypothetical protein